jgi:RNA polymerase sigma-70 factor (ECF subfamily)
MNRVGRFPSDTLVESSMSLLTRARAGDRTALEALFDRYRPRLRRWAHRRLPPWARDLADTEDLVQDALMKTVRNLDRFAADRDAGFQNYLHVAIGNAIRDEIRRVRRRPAGQALDDGMVDDAPSPLDETIGRSRLARYRQALDRLTPTERAAVVARVEFGFTHAELAAALGKPTPDAARKECEKAIARLLIGMQAAGIR